MGIPTFVPYYLWGESLWVAFWMNLFRYSVNYSHLNISNTLNHSIGTRPYDKGITATESTIANFWTFGEGYHNFHHTFPHDYKGMEHEGLKYFNLSTLVIEFFAKCGWVYDLRTASPEMVKRRINRTGDGSHCLSNADKLR